MPKAPPQDSTLVIGAGVGGLAAALRLAGAGRPVHVVEAADHPGGKIRTVSSIAGPVDAGPTVLTLRPVFEELFAEAGLEMADYVTTVREPLLARHWWPDGTSLDLHAEVEATADAVHAFAGPEGEQDFRAFHKRTSAMFQAFDAPVMRSASPDITRILLACLKAPSMLGWLMPGRTMWSALTSSFRDPRLQQLFGRYATYVGGSPFQAPALLSLIWQAEAGGVWRIEGGMAGLANGLAKAAADLGVEFSYGSAVQRVCRAGETGFRVRLADGSQFTAGRIVFNGDPAALHTGLLGPDLSDAVDAPGVTPRSLSAHVWSFAAKPSGRDLAHHNVFFSADYRSEFREIMGGAIPTDPTLYVCAQDRGTGITPNGPERFEIIMNAAPVEGEGQTSAEEIRACQTHTFRTLSRHGLDFDIAPERRHLTTPKDLAARFPGSAGSIYGRSPHGMMATFQRPAVQSRIPGLYLAGGGVHPGAGLPMAATSGRHAAEAILTDHASISRSRRTAMPGGMSTASRMTPATASRSSVS